MKSHRRSSSIGTGLVAIVLTVGTLSLRGMTQTPIPRPAASPAPSASASPTGSPTPSPSASASQSGSGSDEIPVAGPEVATEEDFRIVRDGFSRAIRPLDHSVYVFNWNGADPARNGRNQLRNASDGRAYRFAKSVIPNFWANWGTKGAAQGGQMGIGLYLAVDPIATRNYGKAFDSAWVLTRIELPAGLRVLDLGVFAPGVVSNVQNFWASVSRLGCSFRGGSLDGFMSPRYEGETPHCRERIRKILRDDLRADILAYPYNGTRFQDCAAKGVRPAFVAMNDEWIRPDSIRGYNTTTESDREERIAIESLFRLRASESSSDYTWYWINAHLTARYPDLVSVWTTSGKDPGTVEAHYRRKNETADTVETFPLPPGPPYGPRLLSIRSNPFYSAFRDKGEVLWPDVMESNVLSHPEEWLRAHILGCDGRPALRSDP